MLIQPPVEDFYDTDIRLQPIGLGYLKAVAQQHDPNVEVIVKDFHAGWRRTTLSVPSELSYLKDYYRYADRSPFSGFHQYYRFGASSERIVESVQVIRPDCIGISSLFSPYYREAFGLARQLKRVLKVPIVLGGGHVSAVPEWSLNQEGVDFVIRGEGERPFVEFLECVAGKRDISQVSSLGYRLNGKCHLNPIEKNFPLDELPVPDFSDLDQSQYTLGKKPIAFVVTSRSCPHRCAFCSVHTTFGDRYRRRAIEGVVAEIRLRYEQGYRIVDFEDDNLTFSLREMKQLCRGLIATFSKGEMEFMAMNGVSYASLDDELLELMKEAGFTQLNIALVSNNPKTLEGGERSHTVEKYLEVVTKAHALDLKVISYQILGLPGESVDSMIETLAFQARLPVLLGASMFYLVPGSPLAEGKALTEEDFFKARLTAMAIETKDFRRDDIYTLFISTRILNFLKSLAGKYEQSLSDVLERMGEEPRAEMGIELLRDLLGGAGLSFWTKRGKQDNPRFQRSLFLKLMRQTQYVTGQTGGRIELPL